MLHVDRKDDGTHLILKLSGVLDETTDLVTAVGALSRKNVLVNTKEISRINSVGVKFWFKWMNALQTQGAQVKFQECSPAFITQLNLIPNFTAGFPLESIMVPFRCEGCRTELSGIFPLPDLKNISYVLPNFKCPKCSAEAVFDDDPQEYFAFALRSDS